MSAPSPSQAEVRSDLAVTLEEYDLAASRQGFVGNVIAPVYNTPRVAGTYKVLRRGQLLQEHPTERAPDGSYNRADFRSEEESYATKERGFEVPIDDNLKEQYRDYFDAEVKGTEICRDIVLRGNEQRLIGPVQQTSNVGSNGAVSTTWDNAASTPIDDVQDAQITMRNASGLAPNLLVIEWELYKALLQNDQILERLGNGGTSDDVKTVNLRKLAELFDIERIVISNAQKNIAIPNEALDYNNFELEPLWNKRLGLLAHVDTRESLMSPTFARTFHWDEDGSEINGHVETYREERTRCDVVRVRNQIDIKIVDKACGHLMTGLLPA